MGALLLLSSASAGAQSQCTEPRDRAYYGRADTASEAVMGERWQEAYEAMNWITTHYDYILAHFSRARILHRLGRLEEALEGYEYFLDGSEGCRSMESSRERAQAYRRDLLAELGGEVNPNADADGEGDGTSGEGPTLGEVDGGLDSEGGGDLGEGDGGADSAGDGDSDGDLASGDDADGQLEGDSDADLDGTGEVGDTASTDTTNEDGAPESGTLTATSDGASGHSGLHGGWIVAGVAGALFLSGLFYDIVAADDLQAETHERYAAGDVEGTVEAQNDLETGQDIETLLYASGLILGAGATALLLVEPDGDVDWDWVLIGTGGALLATALLFDVTYVGDLTDQETQSIEDEDHIAWMRADSALDDAQAVSLLLYGTGGAALAAGVVVLLVEGDEPTESAWRVAPVPVGEAGWGLSLEGGF